VVAISRSIRSAAAEGIRSDFHLDRLDPSAVGAVRAFVVTRTITDWLWAGGHE
jgi:hypothetical protein